MRMRVFWAAAVASWRVSGCGGDLGSELDGAMKCLTAPHEAGLSPHVLLRLVPGSLAALLFIALTPLLLAYHDVPGLSTLYFRIVHAGPQPHSPLSLLYKDPHHNHPLLAQKAFVIALEWVVRTPRHAHHRAGHSPCPKRNPHAAPCTRLPQYSLDEEVRIVCYSPPLPKKRRGMCVVALAQCVATHPPLLRVVPPPPPVQMRKVVTLTSSPG